MAAIHICCVHRKRQTAVSTLRLEVRSFEAFSFLDRHWLLPKKKIEVQRWTENGKRDR